MNEQKSHLVCYKGKWLLVSNIIRKIEKLVAEFKPGIYEEDAWKRFIVEIGHVFGRNCAYQEAIDILKECGYSILSGDLEVLRDRYGSIKSSNQKFATVIARKTAAKIADSWYEK